MKDLIAAPFEILQQFSDLNFSVKSVELTKNTTLSSELFIMDCKLLTFVIFDVKLTFLLLKAQEEFISNRRILNISQLDINIYYFMFKRNRSSLLKFDLIRLKIYINVKTAVAVVIFEAMHIHCWSLKRIHWGVRFHFRVLHTCFYSKFFNFCCHAIFDLYKNKIYGSKMRISVKPLNSRYVLTWNTFLVFSFSRNALFDGLIDIQYQDIR